MRIGPRTSLMLAAAAAALALLPASASANLYWTSGSAEAIGRASIEGGAVDQGFVQGLDEPNGVAVDSEYVYWTDFEAGFIGRAKLDGTAVEPEFISGIPAEAGGLAVDSTHIYWANSADESIGRANIDGSGVDADFIKAKIPLEMEATDVALDEGHLYWTNRDLESIGRANLNGSGIDQEFVAAAGEPFAVEVSARFVYWSNRDPGGTAIGRADIDGSAVDPAFVALTASPEGIAVDGASIYWTHEVGGVSAIGRAALGGTAVEEAFVPGLGPFIGLLAVQVAPIASASPPALSFGSPTPVPAGTPSAPQSVTYLNAGNAPLAIEGFSLSGANPGDFYTAADNCRAMLAPGASCAVQVVFSPAAAGQRVATLTALTNAASDPVTALSGVGGPLPAGPPGPAGPVGPIGPRGPAGKNAKVTCTVKKQGKTKVKVTCKVKLTSKAAASVAWSLTRNGRTVAHGLARARDGRLRLRLSPLGNLPPGRYVLRLAGRDRGTAFVVR